MNAPAEKISEETLDKTLDPFDDNQTLENTELEEEANNSKASSDLALKLVNAIKSMNSEEITHYEMVNLFSKLSVFISSFVHCLITLLQKFTQRLRFCFLRVFHYQKFLTYRRKLQET